MADDGDKASLMFWMLYFATIAASILVLGAVTVAGLASAGTIADKLATVVLGTAGILFIIWFYVIRLATAD